MTRFRKNTMDHDGNGRKGGSLKKGSRFVKGTNDPDNDGRKGGSLKGDDMSKKAKADELPEAQPELEDRKAAAEKLFAEADAKAADARMRLAVRGF